MKTELFRKVLFWGRGVVLKYCGPFCPEKGQKGPQQGPFSWLAFRGPFWQGPQNATKTQKGPQVGPFPWLGPDVRTENSTSDRKGAPAVGGHVRSVTRSVTRCADRKN